MKKNYYFLQKLAVLIVSSLFITSCTLPTNNSNDENNGDFTVTFNGNGGTLVSGIEVQTVKDASEISEPTYERMGYNFDGWDKVLSTISVTTTINAQWQEKSSDTSISITGFSQEGNQLSFKINNDVTMFSYTDKVTVASKSSWKLFSDVEGKSEIVTKTISPHIGDNINYILVTSEKGNYAFYTVVLRRLDMFTVSFNTDGGTEIPSQQIQEESLIQAVIDPEKDHYTFSGWDYDFANPVMENLIVNAIWTINKYTIIWKNYNGIFLKQITTFHMAQRLHIMVQRQQKQWTLNIHILLMDGHQVLLQ